MGDGVPRAGAHRSAQGGSERPKEQVSFLLSLLYAVCASRVKAFLCVSRGFLSLHPSPVAPCVVCFSSLAVLVQYKPCMAASVSATIPVFDHCCCRFFLLISDSCLPVKSFKHVRESLLERKTSVFDMAPTSVCVQPPPPFAEVILSHS